MNVRFHFEPLEGEPRAEFVKAMGQVLAACIRKGRALRQGGPAPESQQPAKPPRARAARRKAKETPTP